MFLRRKLSVILIGLVALIQLSVCIAEDQEKREVKIESIKAESISNDKEGNLLLEGKVLIKTNILDFQTDKAFFNQSKGLLELLGNVEVSGLDIKINSREMKANLKQQSFSVNHAEINRGDSNFVKAQEFFIKTSGDVELVNSSVNNCSKSNPAWEISTQRITYLKEKNNAVIKGIKLKIKNIPVFYVPYLRTSVGNTRMSGFLTPGLRQTSDGLDLSLPYYFNLAPNYDMVLTPRHITTRGFGIASSFRYLNKISEGEISFSGISNDRRYKDETDREGNRWNMVWKNKSKFNERWFSSINFQSTSDEYFFRDIGNNQFGQTKTSYLPRKFGLTWKNSFLKLGLDVSRYQILNPFSFEEFKSIPSVTLESSFLRKKFSFSFISNITRFEREHVNPIKGLYKSIERFYFIPEVIYTKSFPGSQLSLSTGTTYTNYKLKSLNFSRSSPWVELKYNLFLDKNLGSSVSSILPTFKYIYVEEDEEDFEYLIDSRISSLDFQNLFQRDRYVGYDRSTKNNKLVLGIQYIYKGRKQDSFNSFSLGQALYFNKKINYFNPLKKSKQSPLVAEFKTFLSKGFWSKGMIELDKRSSKVNSASFSFIYQGLQQKRFELRSVYRRKDLNHVYIPWRDKDSPTNQTELLVQFPISKSFLIFGKWQKDKEFNQSNDILVGFEYSNCCLKWGLMHRKWIDEDYFSWRENYSSPFEALSQNFNPSKKRDNTYLFFELKDIGRLGKEIAKSLSSTKLE